MDDMPGVGPQPGDYLIVTPREPVGHRSVPRGCVRYVRLDRIDAPTAAEDDTARPLPVDDLFLPPELDLEVILAVHEAQSIAG